MCTLVILRRPAHAWPLLLAGNRDELDSRPWRAPGRHWPRRPGVVAGLDCLGGGSWAGINDAGMVAVVMNRAGTLGPAPGKRSRGELVLEALDQGTAQAAARVLRRLDTSAYRPFNLVLGDAREAFWLCHRGDGPKILDVHPIPPGLHLLSSRDLDDTSQPRVRLFLPRFQAAPPPDPVRGDWDAWIDLLRDRGCPAEEGPTAAMNFRLDSGFGTVSSLLLALPNPDAGTVSRVWFAAGPPHAHPFVPLCLDVRGAGAGP